MSLINNLQQEYDSIFVQEWSPFLAAVVFPLVSTWLLVNGYFWGVFGGIRNWGDWMNAQIGLAAPLGINVERLQSPWMHNISLMDMCLIIGAWSAAMMARKFQLVMPNRQDLITAAVGGSLMGIGASLAMGCNIGGFFNPVNASSPSGWMMALGLVLGAYIGSKIIVWMMEHVQWGLENGGPLSITQPLKSNRFLAPIIGFMVLIVMIGWSIHWFESGDEKLARRGILILSGFVLG